MDAKDLTEDHILEIVLSIICRNHSRLVGHRLMPRTRVNWHGPDEARKIAEQVLTKHFWTDKHMKRMASVIHLSEENMDFRRKHILKMVEEIRILIQNS